MSWADAATSVVAEVIRTVRRSDMNALRKALPNVSFARRATANSGTVSDPA